MVTTSDGSPIERHHEAVEETRAGADARAGDDAEDHVAGGVPDPHEADHAQGHDRGEREVDVARPR